MTGDSIATRRQRPKTLIPLRYRQMYLESYEQRVLVLL